MPTSDAELDTKRAEVEKLREKVAAALATQQTNERDIANDVTAQALDKEAESLQAQLAELKKRNTVAAVKRGAAAVLDPEANAAAIEQEREQVRPEAEAAAAADEKGK